jgi:hypothetical protein
LFLNQEQNKGMKNFSQIKKEAKRGDYVRVAELAGCSSKNVELIVKEQRPDNFGVQAIFSNYLAWKTEVERTTAKMMKITKKRLTV